MPLLYELKDGVGVYSAEGDVQFEEGLRVLQEGLQEILSRDGANLVLFDLRKSEENRKPEELRGIAGIVQQTLGEGRLALLSDSALYYGMSRMFTAFAEKDGLEINVFQDLDEAIAWLNS